MTVTGPQGIMAVPVQTPIGQCGALQVGFGTSGLLTWPKLMRNHSRLLELSSQRPWAGIKVNAIEAPTTRAALFQKPFFQKQRVIGRGPP
jgi:hypothetical protein